MKQILPPLLEYRLRSHTITSRPIKWTPLPKQSIALRCPAKELFFGGAAGGGKTDFLIADFLQGAAKYGDGWHGIIFRQTTNQFGQIYRRCDAMLPEGTKFRKTYKGCTNVYILPSGATLQIAYLRYDSDVMNYQGNEYTWIAFDEMGNYPTSYPWEFMRSRNRSSACVPCYMRGTGNPGGPGQGWIRRTFMQDKTPMRIYASHIVLEGGAEYDITSCYIPSRLSDNPYLNRDASYAATLAGLPAHLRAAMLYGNWTDYEGNMFEVFNADKHVIRPHVLDSRYWFKFCALDWGWGKPYSLGWWAVNAEGRMEKYREWYGCKPAPEYNTGIKKGSDVLAAEAWEKAVTEGVRDIVVDPKCYSTDDDHETVAKNFESAGWRVQPANNDRINGLVHFNQMLENTDENGIPMLTVWTGCTEFVRTVPALTPDPNNPEDVDTRLEDHIYDESRYASMSEMAIHPEYYIRQFENTQTERAADYDPLGR
jgi:hypothetical protein